MKILVLRTYCSPSLNDSSSWRYLISLCGAHSINGLSGISHLSMRASLKLWGLADIPYKIEEHTVYMHTHGRR